MEYILEELPSYENLKTAADFLFTESENGDNKFYLVTIDKRKLGVTYYNLGIEPSILLKNSILFMGFGTSIIIYDVLQKELLYKSMDAMHVVYELQYNEFFNYIICICELNILTFNSEGLLLWQRGMQDTIYDYRIWEKTIKIQFEDDDALHLSLDNGGVIPNKNNAG